MESTSAFKKTNSALTPKSDLPWDSKDAWTRLIIFYSLVLVLMITLQLGFADLIIAFTSTEDIEGLSILIANIQAAIIGFIGIALTIIFLKYDDKSLKHIGAEKRDKIIPLIGIAIIITTLALFVAYVIESLGNVISFDQMIKDRFKIESGEGAQFFFRFLIVFIGIALGEEIMFRGYIQNLLESQLDFVKSAVISSFLFGFLHTFLLTSASKQVIQSMIAVGVSATIFGFVFAYAYHVTGNNLILPILIHGIWNVIIFFFNTNFDYETLEQVVIEILSQFVSALIIILILSRMKKYLAKN